VTATSVPGERVVIGSGGEWGRHLPLIDDLLATGHLTSRPAALASSLGITYIEPSRNPVQRLL
jgi:hypothetical protein